MSHTSLYSCVCIWYLTFHLNTMVYCHHFLLLPITRIQERITCVSRRIDHSHVCNGIVLHWILSREMAIWETLIKSPKCCKIVQNMDVCCWGIGRKNSIELNVLSYSMMASSLLGTRSLDYEVNLVVDIRWWCCRRRGGIKLSPRRASIHYIKIDNCECYKWKIVQTFL